MKGECEKAQIWLRPTDPTVALAVCALSNFPGTPNRHHTSLHGCRLRADIKHRTSAGDQTGVHRQGARMDRAAAGAAQLGCSCYGAVRCALAVFTVLCAG